MEHYTQPKTKKKRVQVELRDPYWDENSDASAEDGEDCVWPRDDQDSPWNHPPPTKKEKKKLQKQVEAAVNAIVDEILMKKKIPNKFSQARAFQPLRVLPGKHLWPEVRAEFTPEFAHIF